MTGLYATVELICMGYEKSLTPKERADVLRMLADDIEAEEKPVPEFERDEA